MKTEFPGPTLPAAADLYGDLEPTPAVGWKDYVPGLIVTALATLAAAYLSERYGAPLTLMALLVGLALNFLSADARLSPGLAFASRTLLRWGIVLVGARITLGQIVDLGPVALAAIVVILALTLLSGVALARLLGFGAAFGALAGGAVAICGASAALAIATVLGEKRANQAQLALVLVGISAASSLAMVGYPLIAHQFGLGDTAAGFMLGASIHDVAQALGAGYSYSQHAGETAAIAKLSRVALLAPALAAIAWFFPAEDGRKAKLAGLPWFVMGFFGLAALNSTGIVPPFVDEAAESGAAALLACAVTATGIRSPMQTLLESGPRPLLVIVGSTLVALALSAAAAVWLIG
ncbi:phosphoenolpyruvate carboxylase [Sphingomonas sp. DBB INV C78]|uniref:YeiH family protein n=1 Tax=Sphingomonas sp. DBB INV C78 TaxID=3349434 RepID=UPI0036D2C4EF